jgi:hypothetical protein
MLAYAAAVPPDAPLRISEFSLEDGELRTLFDAQALQSVERSLHLNVEVAANHWLAGQPVLMQAAVLYYRLYYLPLVSVLVSVLFCRAEVYPTVLRTLVVRAPLASLVFWLVPMSRRGSP